MSTKAVAGEAPEYVQKMFAVNPISSRIMWSNNKHKLLIKPFTKRKPFADRSLSVKGPRLWNSLLDEMRCIELHE